jgi:hypothetical protein
MIAIAINDPGPSMSKPVTQEEAIQSAIALMTSLIAIAAIWFSGGS